MTFFTDAPTMSDPASGPAPDLRLTRERPDTTVTYDDNGVARITRKPRLITLPTTQTRTTPPLPPAATRSPLPQKIACIDQAALLSVSRLSLSRELTVWSRHPDRVVVSYQPGRRHLVLTPKQWDILQIFDPPQTVPSALKYLIQNRSAIPLREFYELILQACDQGILQTPGYPVPPVATPAPWRFTVPHMFLRPVGAGLLATTLILLFLHPLQNPPHALWWLVGWLLFCIASSLAAFLSAGVLHATEGLIRPPRFIARSLFPRWVIEHDEHPTEGLDADLALAQLIPFAALTVAGILYFPALALPLVFGLLWILSPFGQNAGLRLLRAFRPSPALSTARKHRFRPNRTFAHHVRQHLDRDELRFLLLRAGYCVPWLLIVGLTWAATTPLDLNHLWQQAVALGLPTFAIYGAGGLVALAVLGALGLALCLVRENRRAHREVASPTRPDQTRRSGFSPSNEDLLAFLADTHPFQTLPARYREQFAASLRQTPFTAGQTIIPAGDRRRRLYLVYSGAVEVVSPADKGKATTVIEEGGIVGESVLFLTDAAQPADIRGLRPGLLVSINHEVYETVVSRFVTRQKIEDAIQKIAFLRRIAFSRHWTPHVLDAFARRSITQSFDYGTTLIEADADNLWFFLLMEGELRVMRDGRKIGRLLPGDFFGEISLLRNSPTTAQLVGHHAGRCLALPKADFLTFLTQNPEVAMQIEALASVRLREPVFAERD